MDDPPEGLLIKDPTNGRVYQIFGGKKCWVPSPPFGKSLFKKTPASAVKLVTAGSINGIPTGSTYSANARLIKCVGFPHIYLETNKQKRWICNPSTLQQYLFAGETVTTLTLAQCKAICNGPVICNNVGAAVGAGYNQLGRMGPICKGKPSDGTLFKCATSHVYQQIDGEKQWIPNPATFNRLYGGQGWKKILTYPKGFCKQVESGKDLATNAKLIKCGHWPYIFLTSSGEKRWVCNSRAMTAYFYRFGKVHRLSKPACKKICLGQPLCLSRAPEMRQPAHDNVHSLEPKAGCGNEHQSYAG